MAKRMVRGKLSQAGLVEFNGREANPTAQTSTSLFVHLQFFMDEGRVIPRAKAKYFIPRAPLRGKSQTRPSFRLKF